MSDNSHLARFADFVIGDDSSELGIARAERDYALHCLERELAIAQQEQARTATLVKALKIFIAQDETMEGILWGAEPDTALVKVSVPLGKYREARAALRDAVGGASRQGERS